MLRLVHYRQEAPAVHRHRHLRFEGHAVPEKEVRVQFNRSAVALGRTSCSVCDRVEIFVLIRFKTCLKSCELVSFRKGMSEAAWTAMITPSMFMHLTLPVVSLAFHVPASVPHAPSGSFKSLMSSMTMLCALEQRGRVMNVPSVKREFHLQRCWQSMSSSLMVGIPLAVVVAFLKFARFEPEADSDPNAIDLGGSFSIQEKIFSARVTAAPGFRLLEEEEEEEQEEKEEAAVGENFTPSNGLADEFATAAKLKTELRAALEDAIAREDYKAAAELKEQLAGGGFD